MWGVLGSNPSSELNSSGVFLVLACVFSKVFNPVKMPVTMLVPILGVVVIMLAPMLGVAAIMLAPILGAACNNACTNLGECL